MPERDAPADVLSTLSPFGPDEVLARGAAEDLGPSMRAWRTAKGLSLRAAADELDVAFSYLQKLETGGRARPPKLVLLQRMAAVYGVPTDEVFAAAGVTARRVEDARDSIDRAFRHLVLHPRLCPAGMDEAWVDSFSTKQKKQWIEFAQRAEALALEDGLDGACPINDIILGRDDGDDGDDGGAA